MLALTIPAGAASLLASNIALLLARTAKGLTGRGTGGTGPERSRSGG